MTIPNTFLITYGLHNFVTHVQNGETHTFIIRAAGHAKLVRHARNLISGSFGPGVRIQTA